MKYFSENLYKFFYDFFEINIINSYFYEISVDFLTNSKNNELYLDKQWLYFSNIISVILISFFIILLGIIFPNKAKIIKFLNLISAFYLLIFFYLISSEYIYDLNIIHDNLQKENYANFVKEAFQKNTRLKVGDITQENTEHLNFINAFFEQNHNLYVNFFFLIATLTTLIFFLSICDIFYLEENMKIEYTLLVLYIYISALLLISSLDFISIIILLECIAFSSYILVGFERNNKFSTSSALKYLILAAIPSGFFILGISILYNNYGSFYQDYLDLLIRAFDKRYLITMDWYFIIENIRTAENVPPVEWRILEITYRVFLRHYAIYINELLDGFNIGLLVLLISMLEIVSWEKWTNNTGDFIMDYNVLYAFYCQLSLQFYNTLEAVVLFFQVAAIVDSAQTLTTELLIPTYDHGTRGITPPLYYKIDEMFDKKYNNINKFLGFLSFYKFTSDNFGLEGFAYIMNNLTNAGEIQKINQKYLFEDVSFTVKACTKRLNMCRMRFIDHFTFVSLRTYLIDFTLRFANQRYFSYLTSDEIFTLKTLEEFFEYYVISNRGYPLHKFAKFYNDITLTFVEPQLYCNGFNTFPELAFYFKNIPFGAFFWLYYDNIFLSTYLVVIFLLINLSFKITAAPFHFWAPSVYGGSPLPTITFLSVFSKLTIIFLFINLFLTVFEHLKFIWQPILFFLGVLSIIISIIGAFSEKLFKRFFIYSSIGHVGFMILGIAVLKYSGIQGSIDYLIIYIISSFIVWFIVMHLTKKTTHLISFKGLSFNYPTLSLILVIALFSISGLPPMAGFFVKFEIFYSLINSSQYFIAYILFILTVFSFFYYLRLIKIIYFEENKFIKKNKNLNDIKLRLISILIFILPLYVLFVQEPFFYILKEAIKTSF